MPSGLECVCCHEIPEVKAFHLKGKARLSWNTAALLFTEIVVCRCFSKYVFLKISLYSPENTCFFEKIFFGVTFFKLYQKEIPAQVFSCEYYELFKNSLFQNTPGDYFSEFFTKLAENNCEDNHFPVELFSEISQ